MIIPRTCASPTSPKPAYLATGDHLRSRAANQSSPLLRCLQVSPPVLSPATSSYTETLMVHTFGWSYGKPYIGEYTPPDVDFNRVTFNFTVTSAGRQYDRLALMFFNDTEIFRTSTAEPTQNGIIWTYVKDMSNFLTLFKSPQKIIFDLGNIVDDTYTGSWNTTLTATFFRVKDNEIDPADVIIPVSNHQSASDLPSGFTVPDQRAINAFTLPRNAKKAVFSIAACGQAAEEFWWSNVLSSDANVFGNDSSLYGYSPFRELQLLIDGTIAGVAWPFPVIFTGGIVPGFWRPVVGIDAFDLREDEIDISPFLPLLSDGQEHTFEVRVAGINDDGQGHGQIVTTVGSNWVVTGKLFLWLDEDETSITTGSTRTIDAPAPTLRLNSSTRKTTNGSVSELDYSVKVTRKFSVSSTLKTSSGSRTVSWEQSLEYSNEGLFTNSGNDQTNRQTTSGVDVSSGVYSKAFDYPLWVYSTYNVLAGGNFTIDGKMERGKNVRRVGDLAFPSELETLDANRLPHYGPSYTGAASRNWQNGTASYLGAPALKRSFGSGTTEQFYALSGISDVVATGGDVLYSRHLVASNDTIISDEETGIDQVSESGHPTPSSMPTYAKLGIKAMLGRGPF
ncbi:hypothetical protein EJ04DRAFT_433224 [Polyplosphaeria fusca]|uniref:Peptide N-acetyl-beta-D-glucosaminyl asparaginase amidase A N-terminal domain-containing protein n=1 Tax=Polyplosphaeria fusca TaxID=682080 RepID=A0A9P4R3J2_9PLEO|nr:hypothetical protein EJ04DRAFT_433224 [Polyplosphaeria fusca]